MIDLPAGMFRHCKHHDPRRRGSSCALDIVIATVRDDAAPLAKRLPCMGEEVCAKVCPQASYPTEEEQAAEKAAFLGALKTFDERLADGKCPHCGGEITGYRKVGRCSYAEPCGCRQGQVG